MKANTAKQQQPSAVIYSRVSSEEQLGGYSIAAQLRACREWAEKNGYTVGKEYVEEGPIGVSQFGKARKTLGWWGISCC